MCGTFEQLTTGIVEAEPNVFYVSTSNVYTTHQSYLQRVDLRGRSPGGPVEPEAVVAFDERAGALDGSCLIAKRTIVLADAAAGLIWRVDLPEVGGAARARVWLAHDTMAMDPDSEVEPPPQPGVKGVRNSAQTGYLWYTSTAQKVFMRVPVVTRHRANTIDRVPLEPRHGSEVRHIAGDPFDEVLAGPSSAAWGRGPSDHGRVAYVTTDGGTTAPRRTATARSVLIAGHHTSDGLDPVFRTPNERRVRVLTSPQILDGFRLHGEATAGGRGIHGLVSPPSARRGGAHEPPLRRGRHNLYKEYWHLERGD